MRLLIEKVQMVGGRLTKGLVGHHEVKPPPPPKKNLGFSKKRKSPFCPIIRLDNLKNNYWQSFVFLGHCTFFLTFGPSICFFFCMAWMDNRLDMILDRNCIVGDDSLAAGIPPHRQP